MSKLANDVKTVYYDDELRDEFSGVTRPDYRVPADFDWSEGNFFRRAAAFIVYRLVMTPFAFFYMKLKFGMRIVRSCRIPKGGCFLYANHTMLAGDAFTPSLVCFPKKVSVIVGPANVALKSTREFVLLCGALPLPDGVGGLRRFSEEVACRASRGGCVTVYPEAHIWPYCRFIRPFADTSFAYPVSLELPVFCTTATYSRRRFSKTPRLTVYLDGPFYPGAGDPRGARKELRDKVYGTMCRRARESTWSPVDYVKRKKND